MTNLGTINPSFASNLPLVEAVTAVLNEKNPPHWAYLVRVERKPWLTVDLLKEIVDYQDMLAEKTWEELIELDSHEEAIALEACSINPYKAVIDAVVKYYGG